MQIKEPSRRQLWFWWLVFTCLVAIVILLAFKLTGREQTLIRNQPGLYSVVRVADGDTIDVDMNGTVETVRMIGVDTPETHKPNTPIQCYGPEATVYTKQLIGNQKVRLEADPLETNRDRYNRLLRYIYLEDNTLVEEKLIVEGYGFAYTLFPFSKSEQFKKLEDSAKQVAKGLWSTCQVMIQNNGIRQTNPIL